MSFNFDNVIAPKGAYTPYQAIKPQSQPIHIGYTPPTKNTGTNADIFTYKMLPDEPTTAQFKGVSGLAQLPAYGLQPEPLVMNFGTYLYNQTTGTAANQK